MSFPAHFHPLAPLLFASCACAAPTFELVSRADDGGSSSSVKIWVPILVVVVALVLALGFRFRKTIGPAVVNALSGSSGHVTPPRNSNNGAPRELTAAEMTGTQTNPVSRITNNRSTRAARRTRRTPSQVSTRSLPAYMKEPGEHELVIIQGSQDLEDAPVPTTTNVVMPALDEEDGESTGTHARNGSNASSYVVIPDGEVSHVGTPLLNEFDDNNDTNANASSTRNDTDDSRAALLPNSPAPVTPDPRGEAPPYFEVMPGAEDGNIQRRAVDLTRNETRETLPIAPVISRSSEDAPVQNQPAPATATDAPRRRSVFRGLINVLNPRTTPFLPTSQAARPSQDGSRNTQDGAMATTADSPEPRRSTASRLTTRSPLGHRPSHSGSGSMFSLASSGFHRTGSRPQNGSNTNLANLTSPSAISINSISAPLTHTLVRTDIVYPRSGPTAEQLKFISSREAVGKFGVPYGPDARAFAASASRVNLHGPPPEFEERPSIDGLPSSSSGHGRTQSGASATSHVLSSSPITSPDVTTSSNLAPSPDTSISSNEDQAPAVPKETRPETDLQTDADAGTSGDPDSSTDDSPGPSHAQEATITQANSSSAEPDPEPPARLSQTSDASKTEPSDPPSPTASRLSTASNLTAKPIPASSTPPPVPSPPRSPSPTRPPAAAAKKTATDLTISVPRSSAPTLAVKKSATGLSTAPTSFRMPTTPLGGARAESRASSVASFATAESHFSDAPMTPDVQLETATPRSGTPVQEDELERPSTPRTQPSAGFGTVGV